MHMRRSPLGFLTRTIGDDHSDCEGSMQCISNNIRISFSMNSYSMGATLYGARAMGLASLSSSIVCCIAPVRPNSFLAKANRAIFLSKYIYIPFSVASYNFGGVFWRNISINTLTRLSISSYGRVD